MKTCEEAGLRKLADRSLSVCEFKRFLRRKGYEEAEIEQTVMSFISRGYLDDESFSKEYIEYSLSRNRGMRRIFAELREKGVGGDLLSRLYRETREEYGAAEDELQRARTEAERLLRNAGIPDGEDVPDKIKARIARRLERYGHTASVICDILDEIR